MGSLRDHLKKQGSSGGGGGGDRTPFFKFSNGANTLRFITFNKDEHFFQWLNHQLSRSKSEPCRKTFDEDEYCELCEQVRLLYDANEKEEAGGMRSKKSYWFVVVPLDGGDPEYHWLQLPWGVTTRFFQNMALKNGWTEEKADFKDEDFLDALEAGINKVWNTFDVTFTYHRSAAPMKRYGKISISSRPGKKIEIDKDIPDPVEAWKLIKRWDKTPETKQDAPTIEEMERPDLEEYATSIGVKFTKRMKSETIIKRIKEKEEE